MSLARSATLGAAWTIGSSLGSRLIGIIGTLILTHYLSPSVFGEVEVAAVLVFTVNEFTCFGLLVYLPTHPYSGREVTFHASFYHLLLGMVGLAALVFFRQPLGQIFEAPGMTTFIPGMALAGALQRIGAVPERLLARDLKFARVGVARAVGETAYAVIAVGLAMLGWGGDAIVIGNIARYALQLLIFAHATGLGEWLRPCRLSSGHTRALFSFGIPIWVGGLAVFGSQRWDNLLVSRILGPRILGLYKMAYNLANIPATHIGEHIGDVLLPSFARMGDSWRKAALIRASGLLSLVVFPMAVGLGTVAPTLTSAFFDPDWRLIGPMLSILAVLSVVRPVGWVIGSYLQARDKPTALMILEIIKLIVLLGAIALLAQVGPLWACFAVGIAFGAHAISSIGYLWRTEGISFLALSGQLLSPLLACIPMVGAVFGARYLLRFFGLEGGVFALAAEIAAGALIFLPSGLLLAPSISKDFLGLVRRAIRRGEEPEAPG